MLAVMSGMAPRPAAHRAALHLGAPKVIVAGYGNPGLRDATSGQEQTQRADWHGCQADRRGCQAGRRGDYQHL